MKKHKSFEASKVAPNASTLTIDTKVDRIAIEESSLQQMAGLTSFSFVCSIFLFVVSFFFNPQSM